MIGRGPAAAAVPSVKKRSPDQVLPAWSINRPTVDPTRFVLRQQRRGLEVLSARDFVQNVEWRLHSLKTASTTLLPTAMPPSGAQRNAEAIAGRERPSSLKDVFRV